MEKEYQTITLDDVMTKIKNSVKPGFDCVVAIERGGVLPGYLASRFLDIPLFFVRLHFRNDNHEPLFSEPEVQKTIELDKKFKKILLIDDVSNSGLTLKKAKSLLDADITTLVISGNADISLYGKHDKCIVWPWDN